MPTFRSSPPGPRRHEAGAIGGGYGFDWSTIFPSGLASLFHLAYARCNRRSNRQKTERPDDQQDCDHLPCPGRRLGNRAREPASAGKRRVFQGEVLSASPSRARTTAPPGRAPLAPGPRRPTTRATPGSSSPRALAPPSTHLSARARSSRVRARIVHVTCWGEAGLK